MVSKYELDTKATLNKSQFLVKNWFKLFALCLPVILTFIFIYIKGGIYHGDLFIYFPDIYKTLFTLTFTNILVEPWFPPVPYIYWYFGLALELYLLYAFFIYRKPISLLVILTVASILLQELAIYGDWTIDAHKAIAWIRANFTGWMLPFAFGIFFARAKHISNRLLVIATIIAIILFIPAMFNPTSWQISVLCIIIIAISGAIISDRIPGWRNLWIWIGKLSPFIFVAHPLVRMLMNIYLPNPVATNTTYIIIYLAATILSAIIYRIIWTYLTPSLQKLLHI